MLHNHYKIVISNSSTETRRELTLLAGEDGFQRFREEVAKYLDLDYSVLVSLQELRGNIWGSLRSVSVNVYNRPSF